MTLCDDCPKKDICQTLCPEAELYANQDYVPQKQLVFTHQNIKKWPEKDARRAYTVTEMAILNALADGLTRECICKVLGITRSTLRVHIKNIRDKRLENRIG